VDGGTFDYIYRYRCSISILEELYCTVLPSLFCAWNNTVLGVLCCTILH
jgi:hypothetical protein